MLQILKKNLYSLVCLKARKLTDENVNYFRQFTVKTKQKKSADRYFHLLLMCK